MKNISAILIVTLLLTACSGEKKSKSLEDLIASNNLEALKQKREEIDAKQQEYAAQLSLINNRISELDTVKRLPLVTTVMAKSEKFDHFLELQGNVKTKQNLVIYPEMAGTLTRVYVKEGQNVTKGQLLATIDDGGLSQQVAQLQIQADLAKTTFERQERLWNQKIGSEIQYLQAKSSYEAQQRAVSQLKSQLAKTSVRAPFTGVIDDVITDQGSVVAPGQSQLMRIVNLEDMYIETDVPENYISSITANKAVKVEFPILGKSIDAKIRQAGNFINPANRTFKIEVAVPNKDKSIKPNLTAKLKINDYTNENAILIPQSIISENADGEQYIYIIENKNADNEGNAKRVIIETGKAQGDVIEVTKGLENNAEIIEEGARSVNDGQTVKVINNL
ncbi:Cobalt-zinc-cadmium resistance protein CzcB [Mariniflexile rhizosphaerae]|uniref:efflux RND transporter periplasmic adaptor subunit n=1 Tax=unclassified Mariniflexile TaxID=2643887 RepID=UPI000CB68362|nr:efflux RND transporter periplasmic adaptor subunit [Mariniflexile sp. TRM1-10]AXP80961.1 Cobalt-zinc-cadmium resistance protein CzcB [Mariniflexile sp. TRM1-10]PLB19962.1 MAG: putative Co/Zn/Cd efflux system membrane fusion protein [Flavobacteriaceae bacterium FS1-H7996/R]